MEIVLVIAQRTPKITRTKIISKRHVVVLPFAATNVSQILHLFITMHALSSNTGTTVIGSYVIESVNYNNS